MARKSDLVIRHLELRLTAIGKDSKARAKAEIALAQALVARGAISAFSSSDPQPLVKLHFVDAVSAVGKLPLRSTASRFVAQIFDYRKNSALEVIGTYSDAEQFSIEESRELERPPQPTDEEFARAEEIILQSGTDAGRALKDNEVSATPSIPLLLKNAKQRTLAIRLIPRGRTGKFYLLAVNLVEPGVKILVEADVEKDNL